jgi:hypothetical protein
MTVTDLIVVGGVLINIGIWFQTSRANTKSIETLTENLETHKQAIWPVLTEQGREISNIKGRLGINGGSNGRGHHV